MNTPCEHCQHNWECWRSDWERECDREEEWEDWKASKQETAEDED